MTARHLLSFSVLSALAFAAQPVDVIPARVSEGAVALGGWWNFKYVAGQNAGSDEDFARPDFPVSTWKNITVPGHWELQGFAEPRYADDLADGLGLLSA
jgi:beta-galactosidase